MFSSNDDKSSPSEDEHSDDESWIPPIEKSVKATKGVKRPAETINEAKKVEVQSTGAEDENAKKVQKAEKVDGAVGQERGRRKIPCPLFGCKAEVVHLPKHMRNVHHWSKEAAAKVLSKFNIRKRKNKEDKKKDYHCRRRCPLSDCHSIVRRLPAHLKNVHKLEKSSSQYIDALENAKIVSDGRHPTIRWQEERFRTKEWKGRGEREEFVVNEDEGREEREEEDGYETETESSGEESVDESDNEGQSESLSRVGMPAMLVDFEDWLRSPDGGKRDEKTVKQHSSQLFGMLKAIDDQQDLKSLLDVKLVRVAFLKSHVEAKQYEAGTIKSYLMSLRHFYSFLISDMPENFEFDVKEVNAAREKVKMWSVSYKRESSTRKWKKLEEDTMNRLTPANIRKFEKSSTAREAIKILGQHSDTSQTTVVSQQSYTLVRDFLFTQIFIDNANRPGVLAGMTIDEYKRMRKEGEHYVIAVMKHKTAYAHGPARIVLSGKLKSWLSVFVEIMRPQIASATRGNVFLTWNGKSMESGHITKAVQSVFKKGGMDVKVTSTSFRKAAVSTVHTDDPGLSGKLARHMAHSETTAKKYYFLTEKSKESVETSKKLGELMRAGSNEDATEIEESESQTRKEKDQLPSEVKAGKKLPWNEEDLEKVKKAFDEEINQGEITLDHVRYRVETTGELHGMSPRRVYDKVRKEIKELPAKAATLQPPQALESLHDKLSRIDSSEAASTNMDDTESSFVVPPSERNSSLNNDEVKTLHQLFGDMITGNTTIGQLEVNNRCSRSKEGQKLLNKLTVSRIVNRIKYERRKKRLASKNN